MNAAESVFFWTTALLHAVTFVLVLISLIFKKASFFNLAKWLFHGAFFALTVFGIIRWVETGHPPFVTLFESMITAIWFVLLIFHLIRWKLDQISIIILPVSFISFLLMGWSSSLSADASPLSAALSNIWLFIHASFATSGAAAFLIGASFSIIFLLGKERLRSMEIISSKIPDYASLPKTIQNFLIFGLILWGVMIVSGSIWAHAAWGRYWAWDPIELWSLISWLLYGLLMHARIAFRLSRRLFCWLTIVAAGIVVFSLWGIQYIYQTIHSYG